MKTFNIVTIIAIFSLIVTSSLILSVFRSGYGALLLPSGIFFINNVIERVETNETPLPKK